MHKNMAFLKNRKKGDAMARKRKEPVVHQVTFTYIGTNNQFNAFLKAVIYDFFVMEYRHDCLEEYTTIPIAL